MAESKDGGPAGHYRPGAGASFHIPPVPHMERVPEPKPLKRAPVVGYDVKTLKRQVEFLQQEITERERVHAQVYLQNEEMWKYIRDLIDASHDNADRMKEYCSKLHAEVVTLGAERRELAEKVSLARDSKALLQQIHKNLGNAKFSRDEMEQLREHAEHAYRAAKKENDMLEDSLSNKVKEMQMMRLKIDENENREKYDALLASADEFRFSSKIVLRNALHRFIDGIGSRMYLSGVASKIKEVRYRHLRKKHFGLYKEFMRRKRVMRRAIRRRNGETLHYHFLKLKLHKVMSRVQHSARRRFLLKRTFGTWKANHGTHKFERWSLVAIARFQEKQFVRRIFTAWKGEVAFLQWHSAEVAQLEWRAVRHHLKKVMAAWYATVPLGKSHENLQVIAVGLYLRKRLFHEWTRACKAAWQRRGHLLLRFFRNLRRMVETEEIIEKTTVKANYANLRMVWRRFRSNLATSYHERLAKHRVRSTHAHLSKHKRGILHAFRQLLLNGVSSKRARMSRRAAEVSFHTNSCVSALHLWYQNAQTRIRRRGDARYKLLKHGLASWLSHTRASRAQSKSSAVCRRYLTRKGVVTCKQAVQTWHRRAHKTFSLRTLKEFVSSKHGQGQSRRLFTTWRGIWSRRIFYALQEQKIEVARNMALAELKKGEIQDLKKNHAELRGLAEEAEGKLVEMEEQRDEKEKQMLDYLAAYEARSEEKRQLEIEMEILLKELKRSEVERKKLEVTESILIQQSEREKAVLNEKRANAEMMIDMMRAEAKQLEQDAHVAKEQSDHAAARSEQAIKHSQKKLRDGMEKQSKLQEIIEEKRIECQDLLRDRDTVHAELDLVQKKLQDVVGRDPPQLIEEQNILRARSSELLEVKSNANLAEARVSELTKIIDEMEMFEI